ncbi:MAG: D-aminoacylase [Chloroflexi bacterium]|nr:D-aminoacylase [Chloroflexota bacterium]
MMQSTNTNAYDVLIKGGVLYDGGGGEPYAADLAIQGDRIAAIGDLPDARAQTVIDARGLAVAPGFINMLSWAVESLIADGRSQSDIRQGVTLEVMGEGRSMGPLNEAMKQEMRQRQGAIQYDIAWTTLGEYLDFLARRGVSTNVASFLGAETLRIHALGYADRPPTAAELDQMRALTHQAMQEGAMGLSTYLIYAPACYAHTDELIALAEVAASYGGLYISHIRDEDDHILDALDEFLTIARQAKARAEIYHLKCSGEANWGQLDLVIQKIEAARAEGLAITADMYTYTASSNNISSTIPAWAHEGGFEALLQRLKDRAARERIRPEISLPSAEKVLLVSFRSDALRPLTGKTLAEIAALRGVSPEDTVMDLIVEDDSGIGAVYFKMSEENVRRQIALPWVSFGSDGQSMSSEGVFLRSNTHPRAYGNFARLLGKYVREERIITLPEAVRRLTALPAANLRLDRRGRLARGYFADVVAFDPDTIRDNATFDRPHQYATGMAHVLVNGVPVLTDGEHTGATPGRVVRGPGWTGGETR